MLLLVVYRRKPVVVTVATRRIVEHLDIVEHVPPGFFPAVINLVPDSLGLEQLK